MAGIGFRLRALASRGSYLDAATAYLSSAVLSTGPWLAGVLALLVLESTTSTYLTPGDRSLLLATIISLFAVSLLVVSGPQMLLTRYLADRIYSQDVDSIAPTCTGVLFLNIPCALLAAPFLFFAPFTLLYRALVVTLFLTLTMTWLETTFLSAARGYLRIVLIYVASYACGAGAAFLLGHVYGLPGSLAGFLFGELLCLSFVLGSIYREFPSAHDVSWNYLRYFLVYWDVAVLGLLYTLGTWIDTLLFWVSSQGESIHSFYHLFPPYDTTKFMISLSTIPSMAVFMLRLETTFYRHYSDFFRSIREKGTFTDLERARKGMIAAVRAGSWTILKLQGLTALFFCIIARNLALFLNLAPSWVPLLRIQALAGLGQLMLFVLLLFLLYLDQRRAVLLVVALTTLSNASLTLTSLALGKPFYGVGYLASSWLGAILCWFLLNKHLKHLAYQTFMRQPLG